MPVPSYAPSTSRCLLTPTSFGANLSELAGTRAAHIGAQFLFSNSTFDPSVEVPIAKMAQMWPPPKPKLAQDEFDEAVKTNIEDFDMTVRRLVCQWPI